MTSSQLNGNGTQQAPAALAFPNEPRLELDELLGQLVARAEDVIGTQGRLRGLLAANKMIIGELDLSIVLRHIVEAACQLIGARYGAIGVVAADGTLEEFIDVGIDPETATLIGPLPSGKGLLGALIDDARPIRLKEMTDDPRSIGFPPHHPPMGAFLGVPIRVRDEVYGNLYLAESDRGEFTADDEELVIALAASAGIAINNARLFEQAARRQNWLQASMQITRQLLAAGGGEEPLQVIADQVREIADADIVTVVLRTADSDRLMVEVASGAAAEALIAYSYPIAGTLAGRTFTDAEPVLVQDVTQHPEVHVHLSQAVAVGPVMVLPLIGTENVRGALVVGRLRGRHHFDGGDLTLAASFANHAALALELADAREVHQRVVLLEDRDRIARDLHDHVIQQLFAGGLTVQSVARGLEPDDPRAAKLSRVVDGIDDTIKQIRTSIFQLRGSLGPSTGTARARLLAIVADVTPVLGFEPSVRFSGPVDALAEDGVIDDVTAVTREALTNIARHSGARRADVILTVSPSLLTLEVIDDGHGIPEGGRRSGLANIGHRAEEHRGSLLLAHVHPSIAPPDRRGTHLTWTIPLN